MADLGFDLEEIARLIRLVESRHLSALVVEEEGRRLVIRGGRASHEETVAAATITSNGSTAQKDPAPSSEEGELVFVVAPIVGVFYLTPGPEDPAFVEVGDQVEPGQTVGLLEAMKVFSEIQVEQAGTVVEIRAKNGQLVRSGDCLLVLRPIQA